MTVEEFLKQKHLFQLGDLPTETPNPKTINLSEYAKHDVERGLQILREIDLDALRKMKSLKNELRPLFTSVNQALTDNNKVYLVGCGATGRLSLSLEYLWRCKHPGSEQVCSLMAGGDVALVHSLEGFEDFPEFGARHLRQLGFSNNDLLIGTTEGGETPYVIGAVEEAARTSKRKPQFLYCNTRQILIDKVERSKRVLTNPQIQSYCLETGPMALTGSTRMQASTVLMLAVGLALEYGTDIDRAFSDLEKWILFLESQDFLSLKRFILSEADTYLDGNYTCYTTDKYAITVFTDTTERAPTFNLAPFDNPKFLTNRHSLTYIALPDSDNAQSAWVKLLARAPRPLNWPEIHSKATSEYLNSFDFSKNALGFRKNVIYEARQFEFSIGQNESAKKLVFKFKDLEHHFELFGFSELFDHLTLKMLLNMHSTLVMGRLSRFEGNLMTWVFPSNGKLVDRAARYAKILLKNQGLDFEYDEIVHAQFKAKTNLSPKESIVHKTIAILTGQAQQLESHVPR